MYASRLDERVDSILKEVVSPKILSDIDSATEDRQKAIKEALFFLRHHVATPRLMQGPSPEITAKWILGASPRQLGKGLTKKEANAWILQSEFKEPKDWYWDQLKKKHPELEKVTPINTIRCGRWVDKMLSGDPDRREAMLVERRGFIADAEVAGRIIDRLDEIQDEDLSNSAWGTLEAAQRRITEAEWTGENELFPEEPWIKELPKGVRVLRHFTELRHEGIRMRHCVVSYARKVADRYCMIFSVQVEEKFSTVEVRDDKITQHTGFANGTPPPECVDLMNKVVENRPWAKYQKQPEFA